MLSRYLPIYIPTAFAGGMYLGIVKSQRIPPDTLTQYLAIFGLPITTAAVEFMELRNREQGLDERLLSMKNVERVGTTLFITELALAAGFTIGYLIGNP
jgi:hypothetical protein